MKKGFAAVVTIGMLLFISCSDKEQQIKLQYKDITEMVFASGALEADDQYNLTAQTDGYLIEMNFKEGTIVKKGQILAIVDNDQNVINSQSASELYRIAADNAMTSAPAIQEIKAAIEAAQAKAAVDEQQFERYKRLYENNSISRTEYSNAELMKISSESALTALKQKYKNQQTVAKEQKVLRLYNSKTSRALREKNKISSIEAGKVYKKKKQLGDYVQKGDLVAVVGNPSLFYARLQVDEASAEKLKIGQRVLIKLNTNSTQIYKAVIGELLPAFDEASRSFIVKAYFKDTPNFKVTGTQLEANIIIKTKKNTLVIPKTYLSYDNKVIIKEDKSMRKVLPGIVSGEWVEIIKGLKAGETILKPEF